MNSLHNTLPLLLLTACAGPASTIVPDGTVPAQDDVWSLSVADEAFLDDWSETYGYRLGSPRSVHFVPEEDRLLYLRSEPRSPVQSLYELDLESGDERTLLTAEQVLAGADQQFSQEELDRRERLRQRVRGITSYQVLDDSDSLLVPLAGSLFLVDRVSGVSREVTPDSPYNNSPIVSPNEDYVGVVRDGELWVVPLADGEDAEQLTHSSETGVTNGLADFIAQEEMGRYDGFWWSTDGERIAFQETDDSTVEMLSRLDPMDPGNEARQAAFPRAGTDNPVVRLGVIALDASEPVWISWDSESFPYLATVRWASDELLTLVVEDRAQHTIVLLGADPNTGTTWEIHREEDQAWINLDQDMPRWLDDGETFLWTTERTGARSVELRDREGALERVVVEAEEAYSGLVHVDEESDSLWFRAQPEPSQSHVFRAGLRTEVGLEQITVEPGWHSASVSDEGHWLHTASLADGTNVRDVVRVSADRIPLRSSAVALPFETNLEVRHVGEREFRASIVRPADFDETERYPVIVSVYGGPMAQTVRLSPRSYVYQQWLANHGFVVVSFDGRGTPNRGRDWERASDGRFVEIALEDQAAALEALLVELPELDGSRVGVMGWSFGGTMAAVMTMRRPDLYRCGISGAPVTEWRDYDTHYTERYLGLPEEAAEAYDANNVLPFLPELERPLLLIHGAMDDNVYFSHSVQLFDQALRLGAPVEFLPLFGATHMVADRELSGALQARYLSFFAEHLASP